jgi:tRNA 2-thiocytidine biosynthesis protein TtcA
MNLKKKLAKAMSRAIADFEMIKEGDRILCAVSGGKDSYALHDLLVDLRRRAPVRFDVIAVNIDQGHPGYPGHMLTDYMAAGGHPFRMVREDTYAIVTEKIPEGKTYCSLCSRLRRGILYRLAREMECTKIALGHHRDDAVTTLMLNLVFAGQLKAMPPKLVSDAGDNVVIRPLIYCAEADLAAYADEMRFPIIPCDLCGSQDNLQRKAMSRLLSDLDARFPGTRQNMLAALGNVRPSHLFDKGLWQRLGLEVAQEGDGSAARDGSGAMRDAGSGVMRAFDEDESAESGEVIPVARLLRGTA